MKKISVVFVIAFLVTFSWGCAYKNSVLSTENKNSEVSQDILALKNKINDLSLQTNQQWIATTKTGIVCQAAKQYGEVDDIISDIYNLNISDEELGTKKETLLNLRKEKAIAFVNTAIEELENNRDIKCVHENAYDLYSNVRMLDHLTNVLAQSGVTLEEAQTTPEKIKELLRIEIKKEIEGSEGLKARWKQGSSDAQGTLWRYLQDYNFTAQELGLTEKEKQEILK